MTNTLLRTGLGPAQAQQAGAEPELGFVPDKEQFGVCCRTLPCAITPTTAGCTFTAPSPHTFCDLTLSLSAVGRWSPLFPQIDPCSSASPRWIISLKFITCFPFLNPFFLITHSSTFLNHSPPSCLLTPSKLVEGQWCDTSPSLFCLHQPNTQRLQSSGFPHAVIPDPKVIFPPWFHARRLVEHPAERNEPKKMLRKDTSSTPQPAVKSVELIQSGHRKLLHPSSTATFPSRGASCHDSPRRCLIYMPFIIRPASTVCLLPHETGK